MSTQIPDHHLRFLFLGVKRPWRAPDIEGLIEPPPEGVWEVRSLPCGLTAWGETFDLAVQRLQRTIDAAFAHAAEQGMSSLDWYCKSLEAMDSDDSAEFRTGWSRIAAEARETFKSERPSFRYEYGMLDEPSLEAC